MDEKREMYRKQVLQDLFEEWKTYVLDDSRTHVSMPGLVGDFENVIDTREPFMYVESDSVESDSQSDEDLYEFFSDRQVGYLAHLRPSFPPHLPRWGSLLSH